MAQHSNYWSNTRFAEWIRGTVKPTAETREGWRAWYKTAEAAHPVRYWIAEEGLDHLQDFVTWPIRKIYDAKYYINNRWVTRTHQLTAHARDIAPGGWCDVGYRFLPCLFNELVDFVEVELAWWHIAWEGKSVRQQYQAPFWATGWFRWRTWRCPQAGIDNLHWQMELTNRDWISEDHPDYGKSSPQAETAREIYELYRWWTEVRPARPDPYEASGWSAYCDQRHQQDPDDWPLGSDKMKTSEMLEMIHVLEEQFEAEDEAMMIRLIKIRRALWT